MNPSSHESTNLAELSADQRGEWLSAYVDGELSSAQAAVVERWIADDPAAATLVADLQSVSQAVRGAPTPSVSGDLRSQVLAEAVRRQAAGEGAPVEPRRLEPEGEFGLPFGRSVRGWGWAGVAVAAAVLIGFFGRPDGSSGSGSGGSVAQNRPTVSQEQRIAMQRQRELFAQRQEQALRAMSRVAPGLQVVNYRTTPQTLQRLQQRLAARPAKLPGELQAVSEKGIVEPIDPASGPSEEAEEQLFYVDADEAEITRLLSELEAESPGAVYRVGADQSAVDGGAVDGGEGAGRDTPSESSAAAERGPAATIRGVRLRLNLSPEAIAKLQAAAAGSNPQGAPQRRLVVLRIQLKPAADAAVQ